MPITAVAATYRVRIADRGATVVTGNVALTLALADLADIPTISGPSVDVLAGTTTSHPFSLDCIVDSVLFTDSNRLAVIGRLCEIQRSEDNGGSWSTLATGRISGASEIDGRGKVTLRVTDERWVERDTQIFRKTTTVQLHPPGLAAAFMDEPAAGTAIYEVVEVSTNAVKIRAANIGASAIENEAPASLREALATDLVPAEDRDNSASNTAGNFNELRFRWTATNGTPITASDNVVISFRQNLGTGILTSLRPVGLLGQMSPSGDGILIACWVYLGSGHGLVATDEITGRFYWPTSGNGVSVNENVAIHIGGATGIHPMNLLADILDGNYGGQAVLYDPTAMTALQALSMQRIWVRETEPVDRGEWLRKNLYAAFNVAPLVGTDLSVYPTALRLGQGVTPGSLTTYDATSASNTDWEHTSRDLVNVIQFSSRALKKLSDTKDRGEDWPADRFEPIRQAVDDIEHDNVATLGRMVRAVDVDIIVSKSDQGYTTSNDVARVLAQEIFDVFGDGPQRGTITVPDSVTDQVGDLIVLDQDTLLGFNPQDDARTGDRIVRLVEFRERGPSHIVFGYLDLGPSSSALSAPTVTVTQDGTDPDLINVAISGLAAGESAVVELEIDTTTPTEYTYRRSGVGNSTTTFRVEASSGTAYARAYAFAPNRIRSAWATDSVALSTRATITKAKVDRLFTTAEVEWTVPADTLGMRTRYSIHARDVAPTLGNQTDYDAADGGFTISGLDGGTRDMVTVELTPYTGYSSGVVSGSAGDTIVLEGVLRRLDGSIFLPRYTPPAVTVSYDENGQAIVSVVGDEEAANIYVTVGDGTSPSDPTAATNDGSVTGRSGTISTTQAVTTGNDGYVRAVAADAAGNLGPVVEVVQARRQGPFHKDTTTRSTVGTGVDTLETITVPGGTIGANGVLHIVLSIDLNGTTDTKTIRLSFGGTNFFTNGFSAANNQPVRMDVLLFNDGSVSSQQAEILVLNSDTSGSNQVFTATSTAPAVNTNSDQDIVVTGECANAADSIDLNFSLVSIVGTN